MPHELLAPTLLHLSWVRIRVSPENRAEPAPCRAPTVRQQPFGGLHMSTQVVKKIVTSKAGQVVLGGIAAGAVGTVGVVMANKWVRTKLADRERRKLEAAAETLILMPGLRPIALGFLLQALIKKGRIDEALGVAAQAEDLLAMLGHAGAYEPTVLLGIAEAYMLAGEKTRAHAALTSARQLLLDVASRLPDDTARTRYLYQVPYHARVMQLYASWLGAA